MILELCFPALQDRAFVAAEKYKEGKFILELSLMMDVQ